MTHFLPEGPAQTTYNIHLFQMNASGDRVIDGSDSIIHQSQGSEANKLYKIHGFYFHYYSEVAAEGRVAMMERSRSLHGPWEIRQLIHVDPKIDKEPNQGGFFELPSHKWYFVSHQGSGDWEGRAGVLLPVAWLHGWPVIGKPGPDGIGHMVWRGRKPIHGYRQTMLSTSDTFDSPALKPEWEWNYQPRAEMWSLTERPGYLRLHAFQPLRLDDFKTVGNIITQRAYKTRQSEATIKIDLSGMTDGQEAGLTHFARTYCTFGVLQKDGVRRLTFNNNGKKSFGEDLQQAVLYLRSTWEFDGSSRFSYSTDGIHFKPFGDTYQLTWGSYRGDRIGIFTVNATRTSGYVDIDSFEYHIHH